MIFNTFHAHTYSEYFSERVMISLNWRYLLAYKNVNIPMIRFWSKGVALSVIVSQEVRYMVLTLVFQKRIAWYLIHNLLLFINRPIGLVVRRPFPVRKIAGSSPALVDFCHSFCFCHLSACASMSKFGPADQPIKRERRKAQRAQVVISNPRFFLASFARLNGCTDCSAYVRINSMYPNHQPSAIALYKILLYMALVLLYPLFWISRIGKKNW